VAVGGAYGTLSEIAFALRSGKPVVGLDTWALDDVVDAPDPEAAVALALELARAGAFRSRTTGTTSRSCTTSGTDSMPTCARPAFSSSWRRCASATDLWSRSAAGAACSRYLVDAGHRVLHRRVAGDASSLRHVPGTFGIEQLTMPDDPVPPAGAVVSIGHPLCYLPTAETIDRALLAGAGAPVVLAVDLEDLEWRRRVDSAQGRVGDDWATSRSTSVAGSVRAT
jgi:hypothetical protein